jgi:predicted lipoprotein
VKSKLKVKPLFVLSILAMTLPFAGCKVFTDQELAKMAEKSGGAFDPGAYVDKMWDSKVVPTLKSEAVDAPILLAAIAKDPEEAGKKYGHRAGEGNPWSYEIKGTGKVTSVDTSSRHGLMTLEIPGQGTNYSVTVQIGPVVFGTALRDSLPFIHFGDFVNQLQFAKISRALNDRAVKEAETSFDAKTAEGATVTFVGATTVNSASSPIQITPVVLETRGSGS